MPGDGWRTETFGGVAVYSLRTPDPDIPGTNMVVAYAHFARASAPLFQISPDRRFTPLSGLLDQPPRRLGVLAAFDDHFIVLCADRDAMRRLWSARSMRALLGAAPYARIASDGKTVTFNSGDPIHPNEERAALAVIADVVRHKARAAPAPRAQPAANKDARRDGLFRVTVDGVPLWVNYTEPVSSRWPYPFTASAEFALPGAPVFQVSPDHGFHFLAAMLGHRDTELGVVPAFDHHFIVRCDDAALVRAAMPARIMQELVTRVPYARLTSDGHTITLSSGNPVTTNQQMVAAVTTVATLAAADSYGFGAMRALPGAHWIDATRAANALGLPEVHFDTPAPARLHVIRRGHRPVTQATGPAPGARVFSALIDDRGIIVGTLPAGTIPHPAMPHARHLRRTRLEATADTVTLTWPHLERDPVRLHAALALLAAFHRSPNPRF